MEGGRFLYDPRRYLKGRFRTEYTELQARNYHNSKSIRRDDAGTRREKDTLLPPHRLLLFLGRVINTYTRSVSPAPATFQNHRIDFGPTPFFRTQIVTICVPL